MSEVLMELVDPRKSMRGEANEIINGLMAGRSRISHIMIRSLLISN